MHNEVQELQKQLHDALETISRLEKLISQLTKENQQLKERVAYLESLLNNNSSNTSLPPSTDKIKRANSYNGRIKTHRKPGGQPGHQGKTLTKEQAEELIKSGKCEHEIIKIGEAENMNPDMLRI